MARCAQPKCGSVNPMQCLHNGYEVKRRADCPHKPREEQETEPTPAPVVTEAMIEAGKAEFHSHFDLPATTREWLNNCFAKTFKAMLAASPNHSDCVAVPREVVARCVEYARFTNEHATLVIHEDQAEADLNTLAAILERG